MEPYPAEWEKKTGGKRIVFVAVILCVGVIASLGVVLFLSTGTKETSVEFNITAENGTSRFFARDLDGKLFNLSGTELFDLRVESLTGDILIYNEAEGTAYMYSAENRVWTKASGSTGETVGYMMCPVVAANLTLMKTHGMNDFTSGGTTISNIHTDITIPDNYFKPPPGATIMTSP